MIFSQRIERAVRLSLKAHQGQVRKAEPDVPYATHPIHVALMVARAGGDEDSVIAALLHDLLEDTDVTSEDLEAWFGPRVAGIVQEVSEDKSLPWEQRKSRMVERLRTASPEAALVAAADKLHNLETLVRAEDERGPEVWDAFRRGPALTVRFHAEAIQALHGKIPQPLEDACRRSLKEAEEIVSRGEARKGRR